MDESKQDDAPEPEFDRLESVHARDGAAVAVAVGAFSFTVGMLAAYLRAKYLK